MQLTFYVYFCFKNNEKFSESPDTFNHQSIHQPLEDFWLDMVAFQSQLYNRLCGTLENSCGQVAYGGFILFFLPLNCTH